MTARKPIGKKMRFEVFKRDRFTCLYCGAKPPAVVLEVDHVVPVSKGGISQSHNLVTSCFDCNRGKRDSSLGDVPMPIVDQLQIQVELRLQVESYNKFLMKARGDRQRAAKRLVNYWNDQFEVELCENKGFGAIKSQTMATFLDRMPEAKIMDAIDIAKRKVRYESKAFKYFCGVCWSMIKEAGK
jgi:hypothetical protein